jgi:hypothetical protein
MSIEFLTTPSTIADLEEVKAEVDYKLLQQRMEAYGEVLLQLREEDISTDVRKGLEQEKENFELFFSNISHDDQMIAACYKEKEPDTKKTKKDEN